LLRRSLESEAAMKKSIKKLSVNKQSIRMLTGEELIQVEGGWIRPMITMSCPPPSSSNCSKTI
jgi:hypothetical protein